MIYSIEGKRIKVVLAKSLTMGDNNYYAGIFTENLVPINKTFRAFSAREDAEKWLKESFEQLFPEYKHIYRV